jgi:hypothetical protein
VLSSCDYECFEPRVECECFFYLIAMNNTTAAGVGGNVCYCKVEKWTSDYIPSSPSLTSSQINTEIVGLSGIETRRCIAVDGFRILSYFYLSGREMYGQRSVSRVLITISTRALIREDGDTLSGGCRKSWSLLVARVRMMGMG